MSGVSLHSAPVDLFQVATADLRTEGPSPTHLVDVTVIVEVDAMARVGSIDRVGLVEERHAAGELRQRDAGEVSFVGNAGEREETAMARRHFLGRRGHAGVGTAREKLNHHTADTGFGR